ncbi:MAG: hypothetical protein KBF36_01445 [Chitinophagaceae bacterium]|nr:hypothetical protein [Chitinophagaceae bacterium]
MEGNNASTTASANQGNNANTTTHTKEENENPTTSNTTQKVCENTENNKPLQNSSNQFPSPGGVRGGLSKEAINVLNQGKLLWQAYFTNTDVHTVREELKLNRSDVGWYQIRKALQARNASGDYAPVNFKPFEEAYKALTEKLQPMVYELGFLRV